MSGRGRMGVGKKPPLHDDGAVRWLMGLSKAALCDCVIELLRCDERVCGQSVDDEVTVLDALIRLKGVCRRRGDRVLRIAADDVDNGIDWND